MTYKNGFLLGLLTGFFFIGVSTGFFRASPEGRENAQLFGSIGLMVALAIAILRPLKRGSVINPTADGFFTGFGLSTKLYATALYGFRFP